VPAFEPFIFNNTFKWSYTKVVAKKPKPIFQDLLFFPTLGHIAFYNVADEILPLFFIKYYLQ